MKSLITALATLFALSPVVATSEPADNPVVVELFTSQGCSSCPPADALLETLSKRDDIIALALHVDYWDYIGWKDDLADPAFTERQKGYAHASGSRMVYTPQMIINGQDGVVGTRAMEVADLIMTHRDAPDLARVDAQRTGDTVAIRIAPLADLGAGALDVKLITYLPQVTTDITRGENAGLQVLYVNSVRSLSVVASWDGQSEAGFDVAADPDEPAAVLVQKRGKMGPGAIVAATWID
ncbi:MAG: DUF1223 domain-containing protein [Marinibacterium sp.]|nr:DUF1223 domain-containing protein [Marinibacterium sp.]